MRPDDPRASGPVTQLDPDFGALAVEVGSWTWSRPGLSPRFCSLLCIAADVCCGTTGMPLQMHVQIAMQNGATPGEIREVILTVAPWAGYPQCLVALMRLKELLPPGEAPAGPAQEVPELRLPDSELAAFLGEQVRRVWSRPGLPVVERALLTLAVDTCLQTLGPAFRAHLDLARAAGATDEQIRSTVCFVGENGFGRSLAALEAMNTTVGGRT